MLRRSTICRTLALAGLLLAAAPAAAETAPPSSDSFAKALTKAAAFEVASSTLESGLFFAFHGAAAASGAAIFGVSFVTAGTIYVLHELAWDAWSDAGARPADPDIVAGKSVSYRIASTVRSFAIGNLLGGAGVLGSAAYAATVAVADTGLYAGTEYLFAWWRGQRAAASVAETGP